MLPRAQARIPLRLNEGLFLLMMVRRKERKAKRTIDSLEHDLVVAFLEFKV